MSEVLWHWPAQTRVARIVPKNKFYDSAKVSSRIKDAFVSDVERITWAYKLSPQTLTLAGTAAVPEIQVFAVEAKPGREVSGAVLDAIDSAVQTPIVFEEYADSGVRTRAAGKHLGPKGPKLSARFDGGWLDVSTHRAHLPAALDLEGLYSQLLSPLLPFHPRLGEPLSDALGRIEQAQAVERLMKGLESRMAKEQQLNRKFEIRNELRQRVAEYEALTGQGSQ